MVQKMDGSKHGVDSNKKSDLGVKAMHAIWLAAIVDSSDDAIIGKNLSGIVTSWNSGAEKMFGYPADEMLGESISKIIPPELQDEERMIIEQLSRGMKVERLETMRQTRDGRMIDVSITSSPVKDSRGRIIGASKIARDITERKQAENQLRKLVQEIGDLKTALDEHAIVAITDPQGKITFVNDKFCAISKYSREELLGQDHRLINSAHHPKSFIRDLWRTIARGQVWHGEMKNRAKDGTYYWVDTTIKPFLDENGKPRQYVAIRADITQRKAAEQALHERNLELEHKNAELERFLYAASHDLKSPVVTVRTFLGYLENDMAAGDAGRIAKDVEFIRAAADKMARLLDELLEISRIGRAVNPPGPVTLRNLVDDALAAVAGGIAERGVTVRVDDRDLVLFGDRVRLAEVFQNLLDNACKFMGGQKVPCIETGFEARGEETVFFVRDNGIGIDPRYQAKVFGLFERLDPQTEGTGIGLSLVKRIVELHGGRIWVESPGVDRGACFYFTLPAAVKETKEGEEP